MNKFLSFILLTFTLLSFNACNDDNSVDSDDSSSDNDTDDMNTLVVRSDYFSTEAYDTLQVEITQINILDSEGNISKSYSGSDLNNSGSLVFYQDNWVKEFLNVDTDLHIFGYELIYGENNYTVVDGEYYSLEKPEIEKNTSLDAQKFIDNNWGSYTVFLDARLGANIDDITYVETRYKTTMVQKSLLQNQ